MVDADSSSDLYRMGREYMSSGNLESAIDCFNRSNDNAPHFKTLELKGECLFKLGRSSEAVAPLVEAVRLNSGVRAASLLADVYLSLGELSKSRDAADEAISRDPNNRLAKKVLGSLSKE